MPVRGSVASVVFLGLLAAFACAEQEEAGADGSGPGAGGAGGGGLAGKGGGAGTFPIAGASSGGTTGGSGGSAGSAGRGGASGSAGKGGTTSSSGGTSTAGSTGSGGSGQTPPPLGCLSGEGGAGGSPAEGGAAGAAGSDDAAGAAGIGTGGDGSAGAGGDGSAGAGGGLLFFDDFEDGLADGWEPAQGSWSIGTDGSFVYQQALVQNRLQFSMVSGSCWADQAVEARIKVTDFAGQSNSYVAALFARALGPETHYMLVLGSDGKLALRKRVNSTSNSAASLGTAFQPEPKISENVWYTLRLEVVGTSLTAYLDGTPRITATDASIASGGVAVGTLNAAAVFDDVRVSAP